MVANVGFLILGAVIGIVLGYFIAASRKTIATETDNSELITLRQDFAASKTRVDELTPVPNTGGSGTGASTTTGNPAF